MGTGMLDGSAAAKYSLFCLSLAVSIAGSMAGALLPSPRHAMQRPGGGGAVEGAPPLWLRSWEQEAGAGTHARTHRRWLRLRGGAQVLQAPPQQQQQQQHVAGWVPDMELLQVMHDMLEKTLMPASEERTAGEKGLQQLQTRAGFVPALFTVVGTPVVRLQVRQAAALYCKNFIRSSWRGSARGKYHRATPGGIQALDLDCDNRLIEPAEADGEEEEAMSEAASSTDQGGGGRGGGGRGAAEGGRGVVRGSVGSCTSAYIPEEDRSFVREMLVPAYLAAAAIEPLRKPVGECVRLIAEKDFPEHTPTLLSAIVERLHLETHPLPEVVSALLLLREISRVFEQEVEKAPALEAFFDTLLQPLLAVGLAALEAPLTHAASSLVTKVICKILWSSTALAFDHGYFLSDLSLSFASVAGRF